MQPEVRALPSEVGERIIIGPLQMLAEHSGIHSFIQWHIHRYPRSPSSLSTQKKKKKTRFTTTTHTCLSLAYIN